MIQRNLLYRLQSQMHGRKDYLSSIALILAGIYLYGNEINYFSLQIPYFSLIVLIVGVILFIKNIIT